MGESAGRAGKLKQTHNVAIYCKSNLAFRRGWNDILAGIAVMECLDPKCCYDSFVREISGIIQKRGRDVILYEVRTT